MKPNKLLITAAIIILAAVALSIFITMTDKSEFIRQQIEIKASEALGTEVSLGGLNISLSDGRGDLQQLKIRNPQKYNSEYALEIDDATIQFDLSSLTKDVYIIDNITIYGARFTAEQLGMQTNLGDLRKNLKNHEGTQEDEKGNNLDGLTEDDPTSDIKLAIRRITLTNTVATVITEGYGSSEVEIANITLTNVGSAQRGLTPQQLTQAVMQQLFSNVNDKAEDKIKDVVIDKVKDKITDGFDKLFGKDK
ncbi:hypothetical protein EDC56_1375 [Sinobacterium caligoides]|uniref:AsmA-like protein n=1 Tax=Sinobacterium caligoides TaxID=933926 RepID=A0A3N2E133_9GAMM|nr:hypothetical protein [Sinobacterium caligoides]ROS05821.1 hypothetical protein EDC56_1375 [Sinobacterium caligoides]